MIKISRTHEDLFQSFWEGIANDVYYSKEEIISLIDEVNTGYSKETMAETQWMNLVGEI